MKLKTLSIKLIKFYQKHISVYTKSRCVFYPTCSEYAVDAINKYGVIKGFRLATLRIFRCHPWQMDHLDPLR